MQFNKYTHTHTDTHIPPWEDQCERHRMARMTGPDCAVMCNLINTRTHAYTHTRGRPQARSLGSHGAVEHVGGVCHGNGCRQEITRLHFISFTKTGWSSLTHNRVLHQAHARSLRESKVKFVVEDTSPFRERAREQNGRLNLLRVDITAEESTLR